MGLNLTWQAEAEIFAEAEEYCPPVVSSDRLETVYTMPSLLGQGRSREMELALGFTLSIFHQTHHELQSLLCFRQLLNLPEQLAFVSPLSIAPTPSH
jgi:uncharacterized damage-inducible protein DinB